MSATDTIRKLREQREQLLALVSKARTDGLTDEEIVKRLSALPRDLLIDLLHPEASAVDKAALSAASREARTGVTGPGRGTGRGTFLPVSSATGTELNKARTDREAAANSEVQKRVRELRERRAKEKTA